MVDQPAALRVRHVFYREADPDWRVDEHHHDVHQWYICLHGAMRVRLGEQVHELSAERSVVVPPMQPRELFQAGRAPGYVVAIFDPAGIDLARITGRTLVLPSALRDDLHALVEELRRPGEDSDLLVRALLLRLLIGHKRAADTPVPALSPLNALCHEEVVRAADAFMAANLSRQVRRSEIAAALRMSESHLARVYRSATGRTLVDRLTEMRISSAKALLLESTRSVTQVAGEVGIVSFSHFARTFKQLVGVTPSDYRRTGGMSWYGSDSAQGNRVARPRKS